VILSRSIAPRSMMAPASDVRRSDRASTVELGREQRKVVTYDVSLSEREL
jgi:hypothetical protein